MRPLLQRLLAHIEAQLECPTLTPEAAARALGISVRRVHGLLAGTPHTFSRLVSHRRLQRAQALLVQPGRSVVDVAFACGFNSLATFYRHYNAAFGTTPAAGVESYSSAQTPQPAGPGSGDLIPARQPMASTTMMTSCREEPPACTR